MNSQSNNKDQISIPIDSIHELSVQELALFREFQKLKESVLKSEIVSTVSQGDDVATVNFVERELANTIAIIDAEIQKRLAEGKSCFEHNARKIRALKTLSDLIFAKRQVALNEAINLKSESFGEIFREILDLVRGSAIKSGVPEYHIEAMFVELSKALPIWEERTQKKLSSRSKK